MPNNLLYTVSYLVKLHLLTIFEQLKEDGYGRIQEVLVVLRADYCLDTRTQH